MVNYKTFEDIMNRTEEYVINEKQKTIIEAAIEIISEKGFDGGRTQDIAKKAGITEATLFKYYKSKNDLLLAIADFFTVKVVKPLIFNAFTGFLNAREELSVEEALKKVMLDRVGMIKSNAKLIKIIMFESIAHPELLRDFTEAVIPKTFNLVNLFHEKYIHDGTYREINPKIILQAFMSLLFGFVIFRNMPGEYFMTEENETKAIEEIIDIFLNGVKK